MLALSEGDSRWGDVEHLLADVVDALWGANWQRAGDKRAPRPKPRVRPHLARKRRAHDLEVRARMGRIQRLRERMKRKGRE